MTEVRGRRARRAEDAARGRERLPGGDDGSGTFTITFDAATVFGSPQDQGGWKVVGGTGDYETLRGGGNLVGTYIPGGIIDLFTGGVRT